MWERRVCHVDGCVREGSARGRTGFAMKKDRHGSARACADRLARPAPRLEIGPSLVDRSVPT